MRNLKRALSLGLTATMLSSLMVAGASATSYADVTSKNNEEAIDVLKAVGVMTGDENGKFNPDQNVTRAEMATVMAQMLDLDVDNFDVSNIPFTDVPTWAAPYVAACYADGITSGTSATTYSPNDSVTTVQAALMMLKALGYFQYASDFGSDWTLATMKQASKIDLFSDITASSKQAMNRDEVAQLALNTLKATMVEADKTGNDVIIGDIVIGGNVKYEDVTSSSKYAEAFGDKAIDNNSKKYTVELGEKLFDGDLKRESVSDAFGRPSMKWSYKTSEVGTYAEDADAFYTEEVKSKDLYTDLGLSKDTTATLFINGAEQAKGFEIKKGVSTAVNHSDNGVVTEAYKDKEENVIIAVSDVKSGEVTKVTPAKGNEKASITVDGKKYETEGFQVDDKVYYTEANNEIQSVGLATKVEGLTVTKVTSSGFDADGKTYKFNAWNKDQIKDDVNVDSVLDIYTDGNGYVVDVEVSKASKDYAYVIGMDNDRYDEKEYTAKLLMADGTVSVVQLDETNMVGGVSDVRTFNHNAVEFTKNSKDEYTLIKTRGSALSSSGTTVEVNKGESAMKLGSTTYYGNEKTIYLVKESNGNYVSYVGYANVPDMDAAAGKYAVYTTGSSNLAKVVYLENVATRSDDIVYVLSSKEGKKITDTKAGTYYEYKAVVNGEITTVKVNGLLDGDGSKDNLFESIAYSDKEYNILDKNACVEYSDAKADKDDFAARNATVTERKKDGVLALDIGTYSISKDVKVFAIYGGDRIESAGISDLDTVENKTVDVIVKNGEIVSAFYKAKETTNNGGNTEVEKPEVQKVDLQNDGTVTLTLKEQTKKEAKYTAVVKLWNGNSWVDGFTTVEITVGASSNEQTVKVTAVGAGDKIQVVVDGVPSQVVTIAAAQP